MRYSSGFVWVVFIAMLGCSEGGDSGANGNESNPDSEALNEGEEDAGQSASTAECERDEDCPSPGKPCVESTVCASGSCVSSPVQKGVSCGSFCAPAECDGAGNCVSAPNLNCQEQDGNLCTLPKCDPEAEACVEKKIADGLPPYASSDCFENPVCVNGVVNTENAEPTALSKGCANLEESLDPFGCIQGYVCAGGDVGCEAVFRPEGAPCWKTDQKEDATCEAFACVEGECLPAPENNVYCAVEDLDTDCAEGCAQCTEVTCQWLESSTGEGIKTPYCRATARVGESCSAGDSCSLEQSCVLASQTEGPLGKETLGGCVGAIEKTPEDCASELGFNPLPCVLAGMTCKGDGTGCTYDEAKAAQWCTPPTALCFEPSNTLCSHVELAGENWDPETGCQVAWVDIDCDDNNPCTIDSCSKGESGWNCNHVPVDGATCGDGDPCLHPGQCLQGECVGQTPVCAGPEGLPCWVGTCSDGECGVAPALNGMVCEDGTECTLQSTCDGAGACVGSEFLLCSDGNPCTVDSCQSGLGCVHAPTTGNCEDGDGCTVNDVCANGACAAGTPKSCDDNEVCTQDTCSGGDCVFEPLEGECDDGDPCTGFDACAEGQCTGIPGAVNCSDNNSCTEDVCLGDGNCSHNPIPDGFPCNGGGAFSCQSGQCECVPQCTGACGGDDGCGGTCGCGDGQICSSGKCVPEGQGSGDVDYDGQYAVSGNNGMVGTNMTLDFDAVNGTVTGFGIIQFINVQVNYTGTYDHPDFTLQGSYTFGLLWPVLHNETWTLTLAPPVGTTPATFSGTLQDTGESTDFLVQGIKTGP